MAGSHNLNGSWVSCAFDDTEAWKCLALGRSLERVLTRHKFGVIVSPFVTHEIRARLSLQASIYDVPSSPLSTNKDTFTSFAMECVHNLEKFEGCIFLHPNTLMLSNVDELFTRVPEGGVILSGRTVAAMVPPLVYERVASYEQLKKSSCQSLLEKLTFPLCLEINLQSPHPVQFSSNTEQLACFVTSHPVDQFFTPHGRTKKHGENGVKPDAKYILVASVKSLLPELFGVVDNGVSMPTDYGTDLKTLVNSTAIVGMSCRYAGANSIQEFWNLLEKGMEGVRRTPEYRWNKQNSIIQMEQTDKTEAGFLSCPIDNFDSKFFNTNAADLSYLDPQQRMAVRVVWDALEDAGIDPLSLKGSMTGVFGGWWRNEYKEMLEMTGNLEEADFLRGYFGTGLGPMTARISHFYELVGPSISTELGCSTSGVGVHMACGNLGNGQCDLAIAVGANLLLHPYRLDAGVVDGVISTEGRCKTWDSSADGFGRAEGVGVLILKRFPDAVRDGDKIHGIIRGSSVVQEGISYSIGRPTVEVEAKAMEVALRRAKVNPDDVQFLETHGTGTPVGDPIEIDAIARAYNPHQRREKPLIIGSVKTNIGHTESVCGIAGIQKTVLSMKNELIPKHLNLKKLNPEVKLEQVPAKIPLEAIPWKREPGKVRLAGVNSFGITGAQGHFVIQEPPVEGFNKWPYLTKYLKDSRDLKFFTFSAKSDDALQTQMGDLKKLLLSGEIEDLRDLEYSIQTTRAHFPQHRAFLITNGKEDLITKLDTPGSIKRVGNATPNLTPQICFLFTGQGAQYPGMGKDLYEQSVIFKSHFDWADSIVTNEHGMASLRKALFDEILMKQPLYAQTANFVVQYCLLKLLESWGLKPTVVLGHSMGEYVAAVAAGFLSPADGLKLVIKKAKLTDALVKRSSMIAVDKDSLACLQYLKSLERDLEVAALNAESQTVLAGETEEVKKFKGFCDSSGVKATILNSAYGFHSKMMDPMLDEMAKVAREISYHGGSETTKFISSVDGGVELKSMDASYWIRNTREAVRFLDASQAVVKIGINLFLELGPNPVLSALTMTNAEDMGDILSLPTLRRGKDGWETLLTSMGQLYVRGVNLDWKGVHRFTGGNRVHLPSYPFDESKSYWMTVREGEGKSKFHSLVGAYIPSPSETLLFHNKVGIHTVSYLKDHALGDKVIYPCAGFIEMMLVGGHAATKCRDGIYSRPSPGQPVGVKDFQIHSPVCLSDKVATEFQTVVERNAQGDLTVSTFTRIYIEDGRSKWVKNASSIWTSDCHLPDSVITNPPDLERLKKSCCEVIDAAFNYKRLEEYGFNFGPTLQGIKSGYRNTAGDEHLFRLETLTDYDELGHYILHPCLTDPMLQAQNLGDGILSPTPGVQKKTLVPVAIKQLVYLDLPTPKGYIHVRRHAGSYREVFLLSEDGRVIAVMLGAECIETTIHNIMAQIEAQKNPYPTMAEFTWREQLGPRERRVPPVNLHGVISTMREETLQQIIPSKFTKDEKAFYDIAEAIIGLRMLKFLKRLGFDNLPLNQPFHYQEMGEKIGILPTFYKYFRYILKELGKEGWISAKDDTTFFIPNPLPTLAEINAMTRNAFNQGDILCGKIGLPEHQKNSDQVMDNLPEILTGKISALKFLFSEKGASNERNVVEAFYSDSLYGKESAKLYGLLNQFISTIGKASGQKGIARVLEVGAGTGNATIHAIKAMTECGPTHFEYTYTDISPVFLERGKQLLASTGIVGKFGILDIEKCPVQQGFVPGHYDVIIAVWVVHATRSIEESMRNLTQLLRPGGYLLLLELTSVSRQVNILFGGVEGFWRFTDKDVREWHCELPLDKWDKILRRSGYDEILPPTSVFENTNSLIIARKKEVADNANALPNSPSPSPQGGCWVVIASEDLKDDPFTGKLLYQLPGEVILIWKTDILKTDGEVLKSVWAQATEEDDKISGLMYLPGNKEDPRSVCEPFLHVCQFLSKLEDQRALKVALFTRGLVPAGTEDYRLEAPSCSPVVGMMQVLQNENPELSCKCIDIDEGDDNEEAFAEALHDLLVWDEEAVVAYRNRHRCVPRVRNYKVKSDTLNIPSSPRYRLVLPTTNSIDDLQFAPMDSESVGVNEVEVQVKVYGLNFRDTLVVTKPDPFFNTINTVGFDISGVITKVGTACDPEKFHVGQRVVTMRATGFAMPSHVVAHSDYVIPIPDEMTFEEGSTYPAACATVIYCLMEVAKATKDDVVLIHTASGAVGIMAIQLCQRIIGCQVVVTAGTERKRNFLKKGLGLEHVYNSRNTTFQHDIRKALGGRGVTVVLNSLTGPGFKEATLSLCEEGARFVEMSKINIWTKEEVQAMRPDIQYDAIDISLLPQDELKKLIVPLKGNFDPKTPKEKRLMPIPSTRFDAPEIRQALEYLEKVKHVGKVVVRMPDPGAQRDSSATPLFNEFSTYLITGGIGGIGFEVAQWMLKNGARTLILTARRPPKASVAIEIENLRAKGNNVIVHLCDIGDWVGTKAIFETVENDNLPPLRGIMHVAGVIDDGSWETQSWKKFDNVFKPKVDGTMNLHKLSLTLPYPLEHFVMFSSFSSVIGSVTQGNYVAANYHLDFMAYYRNSLGLPASTINWGQWGGVGLIANAVYAWFKPFTVAQGIAALEHTLRSHKIQVGAYEGDLASVGKSLASCRTLTSELAVRGSGQNGEGISIDSDAFWNDYDAVQTFEEKYDVVRTFIRKLLRQILRLGETDEIDDNANLQEMGVDSLMMVEMKNGLQSTIGKRATISVSAVKDCKTVAQLSEKMVELISGEGEMFATLSREQLKELLRSDAELGEDIVPSNLDEEIKATLTPIENVETVLLTGSSGFFGPYLLRELCRRPGIKKIYLLLRQMSTINLRDRFIRVLGQRGLNPWLEKYNLLDKVEFVQGDLSAKAMLGMDLETYNRLSFEVDAIIDAGARVVFEQPYRESKSPNDPRTVNVLGFKQLLKFSVDGGKLKHLYHTSAALAESRMDPQDKNVSEMWMTLENFENTVDSAYILSKIVCEMLSEKASSRGVPIQSFRLPYLGGDLETGNDVQFMNFLMMRSYGFMTLGFMPAVNFPLNIIPVDVGAKWSLDTFFHPKSENGPYNVSNPIPGNENEFEVLAKEEFHVDVEILETEDFREKLKSLENDTELKQIVKMSNVFDRDWHGLEDAKAPVLISWLGGNRDLFVSKKLEELLPKEVYLGGNVPSSKELLKRDLKMAEGKGLFERFKIKQKK